MKDLAVWVSRATGIGYNTPSPPISEVADTGQLSSAEQQLDRLVQQFEQLERELRRRARQLPK